MLNVHLAKKTIILACAMFLLSSCRLTAPNLAEQPFDDDIKNNSLAISPDETLAIASYSDERGVVVYDLNKKSLIKTLTYLTPRNVKFAKDGRSFFISDSSLGVLRQVSVDDFSTLHEVQVDKGAFGFAINDDYVFLNNEATNTVSVINLETWKIDRVITGFDNPRQGIVIGSSNRHVYVTNFKSDDVRRINTETWKIDKVLSGIPGVRAIALSADESKLYGASSATNSLRIIDVRSNGLIKTIPTGRDPYGAALSSDGKILITGNKIDNTVQVFDAIDYNLLHTIPGFNEPRQAIVYSKNKGKIYILQKDLSIAVVNYNDQDKPLEVIVDKNN